MITTLLLGLIVIGLALFFLPRNALIRGKTPEHLCSKCIEWYKHLGALNSSCYCYKNPIISEKVNYS